MAHSKQIDHSKLIKDWRKKSSDLRYDRNENFTDITLVTKDQSDQRFRCHRVVLSSASTYFKVLFENHGTNALIRLSQDKLTAPILKILIDYMYTADIVIDLGNVISLNIYSETFCLMALYQETNQFLENNIQFDTCLKYWRYAEKMGKKELIKKCIKYIEANPEDFMKFSINNLEHKEISKICEKLRHLPSHSFTLSSIITWYKKDCDNNKFKLEDLLENIMPDRLSGHDINALEQDLKLTTNNTIKTFLINYYKNH